MRRIGIWRTASMPDMSSYNNQINRCLFVIFSCTETNDDIFVYCLLGPRVHNFWNHFVIRMREKMSCPVNAIIFKANKIKNSNKESLQKAMDISPKENRTRK